MALDEEKRIPVNPLTAEHKFIILLILIFAVYSFATIASVASILMQK